MGNTPSTNEYYKPNKAPERPVEDLIGTKKDMAAEQRKQMSFLSGERPGHVVLGNTISDTLVGLDQLASGVNAPTTFANVDNVQTGSCP
jgi:hypothetical protein